jgi:hypothetical protein
MQVFAQIMAALMGSIVLSMGTIVGLVFAGCAASTGGCYVWLRRRRRSRTQAGTTPELPEGPK